MSYAYEEFHMVGVSEEDARLVYAQAQFSSNHNWFSEPFGALLQRYELAADRYNGRGTWVGTIDSDWVFRYDFAQVSRTMINGITVRLPSDAGTERILC